MPLLWPCQSVCLERWLDTMVPGAPHTAHTRAQLGLLILSAFTEKHIAICNHRAFEKLQELSKADGEEDVSLIVDNADQTLP